MHTKLPNISFFKNLSFFVVWFPKNSRKSFWIRNFKANCLSRRDQKVYSIFQNRAPWGTKAFYSKCSRWKWVFVKITNNDHQFFREFYYQKLGNIFFLSFFSLTLWSRHLFPFLEMSTKFIMTKGVQNKFIHFMQMLTSKQSLFLQEVYSQMRTFITKTAPSWSFVLMLLVTVDKSSEFDWICVDQRLNLVFESRAIFHGVPPNSSMVFTLSIDIVLFWIWRSPWPYGDGRDPIILN